VERRDSHPRPPAWQAGRGATPSRSPCARPVSATQLQAVSERSGVGVEPTHRRATPVTPILKTGWATGPVPLRSQPSRLRPRYFELGRRSRPLGSLIRNEARPAATGPASRRLSPRRIGAPPGVRRPSGPVASGPQSVVHPHQRHGRPVHLSPALRLTARVHFPSIQGRTSLEPGMPGPLEAPDE
jgi:hypothetical protein